MKNFLAASALLISTSLFSQTNLVPNHDFNKIGKKVKEKGQINMAEPWISPTLTQADLFIKNTKSGEIATEGNSYGAEDPMEGDNYAGILAYSYKSKNPRSYLQVKLIEPLKQDNEYCVTFHVSLADLSKYACNNIGAYLSNEAVSANNSDVFQFDAQIVSRKSTVYEQQYYWTPVCSKYKAKGGEEYLTIGNFTLDEKLNVTKVKRPQGFNSPQTNDAYYYIDNVIVTLLNESDKCDCDFVAGVDDMETVSKSFSSDLSNQSNQPKIINSDGNITASTKSKVGSVDDYTIYFEDKQIDISQVAQKKMDKLVLYLKANVKDSVSLDGYFDDSEKNEDKIDGKRVGVVYKYLVSKGVAKERIIKEMKGVGEDKDKTKNMKVEIKIKP